MIPFSGNYWGVNQSLSWRLQEQKLTINRQFKRFKKKGSIRQTEVCRATIRSKNQDVGRRVGPKGLQPCPNSCTTGSGAGFGRQLVDIADARAGCFLNVFIGDTVANTNVHGCIEIKSGCILLLMIIIVNN